MGVRRLVLLPVSTQSKLKGTPHRLSPNANAEDVEAELSYMSSLAGLEAGARAPLRVLGKAWRSVMLGIGLQLLSPLSIAICNFRLRRTLLDPHSAAEKTCIVAYATLIAAVLSVFVIDRVSRRRSESIAVASF